ncbi:MAG: TonB-dependent receptor [Ignavibacteria bacterium]|nr:TonB-dependent receptor [Ignavibacteria bacterium]
MKKNILLPVFTAVGIFAGSLSISTASAQLLAQNAPKVSVSDAPSTTKARTTALRAVLNNLSEKHRAMFNYNAGIVKSVEISNDAAEHLLSGTTKEEMESRLNSALAPLDLRIKKIDDANYVIQPRSTAERSKNAEAAGSQNEPLSASANANTMALMQSQTVNFSGTVTDESKAPIRSANVHVKIKATNKVIGTFTDADGKFTIKNIPVGAVEIHISSFSYTAQTLQLTLSDNTNRDFVLKEDVLNFDLVLVTGTRNTKSKLESSVAITTIQPMAIQALGPRSATDIVRTIPGFYTESSGGEGNGNVFARGLPSSGGLRYVQLQEDGLPVFEYGDLMFGNTDIWFRYDQSVERVEAIRGGSASILTSNAPGGVINFISKNGGGTDFVGSVRQTAGLTFRHFRTDFDLGGPIAEGWSFHIGGHYRTDDGIRSPGYNANNGGQIKLNLTKTFDKGYIRVYAKYLNDRTIGYLPIPLTGDPAQGISNFNPNYGTLQSPDFMNLNVSTPYGGTVQEDLTKGMSPKVFAWGAEAEFDLGDGWMVKDVFRSSDIQGQFNAIFGSGGQMWTAADYARQKGLTQGGYAYSYARGNGAGATLDMSNLNGNGLVGEYGWWAVNIPLQQFANKVEISKSFDMFDVVAGYYFNQNRVSANWWWHTMLVDIASDPTRGIYPRALNLTNTLTNTSLTSNGFIQYGSLYRNYTADNTINAPYLNVEFKPFAALSIEGGIRYDIGRTIGFTEDVTPRNYDVDGDGKISEAEKNVAYGNKKNIPFDYSYTALSWSLGANYTLNGNNAAFIRASRGNRAPQDRDYAFGATTSTKDGMPTGTAVESINQYELGYKLRSDNFVLFATGFFSYFGNLKFTDFVSDGRGGVTSIQQTYNTQAAGLELETNYSVGDLSLTLSGTFQDARYIGWTYRDQSGTVFDFNNKFIQRLPQFYFVFTPSYSFGKTAGISATIMYFGQRFTNPDNRQVLPAFAEINANAYWNITSKLRMDINVANILNTIGLTEGDPRSGLTSVNAQTFYARPILGRSATVSLQYFF